MELEVRKVYRDLVYVELFCRNKGSVILQYQESTQSSLKVVFLVTLILNVWPFTKVPSRMTKF